MDKKNIILAFGNKEFNDSLIELKNYLNFNLETINDSGDSNIFEYYQGLIIHEDALNKRFKNILKNQNINKIIFIILKILKDLKKLKNYNTSLC